ncbi:S8 family serine peptidase [Sporosarcina limicola]|uniref:Subtilisin family serine protease n=1 Tax=Sporosarcina limicola TaxID=34101 RepID=A0A927MQT5_9BACL|nr:S8 family serine peptidase [Sporosarcina limicola]MBE1555671.1 subtilisin family serine protease [Sporosarcina limicola]
MKQNKFTKFFSVILAFTMVLSLLTPMVASTNAEAAKSFKQNNQNESILQQKAAIAEQLDLLDGGARLHEELQNISGNQEVAVIVHLSEKSVALEQGLKELAGQKFTAAEETKVKAKVKAQQAMSKKEMTVKNIDFKAGYTFETVLNGFAATVKADDIKKLLDISGVTLVEPDKTVYASEDSKSKASSELIKKDDIEAAMNTSISFLGIDKLWKEGYEGQGIKVAVIDTGIDKNHPEFAGIYKGGKNFVPHTGNDYARSRADNDPSETSPKDRPANRPEFNEKGNAFYTSHGTHVAGTIAAIGANKYGIKGIAPKVDLYAYRVLGAYGSGATSGIIKAIDTAVQEKMDVINLSLGGGVNSETDGGSFAINNAMLAGTISVIATGNSGPKRGTMGTPSTARLGIAVGNTTNPETKYNGKANVTVGNYNLSKQLNLMGTTFGKSLATQLSGEFDIVAVPGVGKATDYTGIDVHGKVALISRGDLTFADKIAFAKENGAAAAIIHNFASGTNAPAESGTFLGDSFAFIPTFDLSQTDGDAIRAALKNSGGKILFGDFASTTTLGDDVNDSSSRGPSTPNSDIKPDVAAPGTNIISTMPMYKADFPDAVYDEAYDRKTGTSMATPHIAGIAALVKQANPNWNAFDVKVALSNTAKILEPTKYDVFSQGAGRVDAYSAAHPNALAYAIDTANNDGTQVKNLKGTVTFGPQSLAEDLSVTKQILVKDLKGKGGKFDVSVTVTKGYSDAKLTIDKPSFTLAGEQLLNVTLTASKKATVNIGDELLGYIHIEGASNEISLPFAADFGGAAAAQIKDFTITETDLSFNGDGVKDEALITFTVTDDLERNFLEIWNIMDPEGGEFADGYIGYLHAGTSLGKGTYTLAVKGQYRPWTNGAQPTTIPDGLYTFDFNGKPVSGNPPIIGDYVGPIVVKSKAGTIEGTIVGKTATGKIIDKYVDYQEELVKYGMDYDINTKLKATFEVSENSVVKSSGAVKLAQDGSFSFDVGTLNLATDTVKVKYVDAAGNAAEHMLVGDGHTVQYSVNKDNLALQIGDAEQLTVTETTTKSDGTKQEKDVTAEVVFQSTDETIATVKKGKVTAVGAGETKVTASYKDFTQIITVKVTKVGQDVITYSMNKTSLTLGIGQQEQLIITETTMKPDGQIVNKDVTAKGKYSVVNTQVATAQKGLVTAKTVGKTQIRVTIPNGETMFVDLEVITAPQDIVSYSVNKTSLTLGVGQQEQLIVTETTMKPDGQIVNKDVTAKGKYSVVNNQVATAQKGLITAKAVGKTQVRVTSPNGETVFVYLEVIEIPKDVVTYSIDKERLALKVGEQEQLTVTEITTKPSGQISKKDITATTNFRVVNNDIASVQKGLVTAKAVGKTQARVNISGQDATLVYIEVTEILKDVVTYSIDKERLALKVGEQEQLTVTEITTKPNGQISKKDITATTNFRVVNNDIASVQKGLVTAKAVGKTQARVNISGQDATLVYIEVTEIPKDVVTYSIDKERLALKVGDQEQLTVTEITTKPDGQISKKDITATTNFRVVNNDIASVQKGLVTAKAAGKTQARVNISGQDATLVYIEVTEIPKDVVTYSIDKESLTLKVGDQEQLTVTEITTKPDGQISKKDITADSEFKLAHNKVVKLKKGLVSAVGPGKTFITITHQEFTATVYVTVVATETKEEGEIQPQVDTYITD